MLVAALLASNAFATEYYPRGGNWSDASSWRDSEVPTGSEIDIRGSTGDVSGAMVVDTDAAARSISMWGTKTVDFSIDSGKTFTIGNSRGINHGDASILFSGAGTFNSSADNGRLYVYGGAASGSLTFTSNVDLQGVYFYNPASALTNSTVIFNATGSNSLTTSAVHPSAPTKKADFNISGVKGLTTTVKLMGNVNLGDIQISNYTNVVIDSTNFSIADARYGLINVADSVLEFVGDKGAGYSVWGKVRLNGNATMIWTGVNSYTSLSNIDFNTTSSKEYSTEYMSNKLIVNGKTDSAGFCLVDTNNTATIAEKVFKIELGEVAAGDDYILKLTNLVVSAGSNNTYCKTNSLTVNNKTTPGAVENMYIEFINFDNNKVRLTNDLLTAEDWEHVRADGWENFRLENGYITATQVPEPAEWAFIFGAIALGVVAYRRRK